MIIHEIDNAALLSSNNLSSMPSRFFILYNPDNNHLVTNLLASDSFPSTSTSKKAEAEARSDFLQLHVILSNLSAIARRMEARSITSRLIKGWWVVYIHLKYKDQTVIGTFIQSSSTGDESFATTSAKEGVNEISIAARKYLTKQLEIQLL